MAKWFNRMLNKKYPRTNRGFFYMRSPPHFQSVARHRVPVRKL